MRFFKHLSYRTLFTKAVMGISVICLFASDGLTASATTIKEENIAYNQSLAVQSNAVANWPTGPVISAESAILMDADTGAILYAKNIHQKEYPASTTKILTTLIASERCSMDEIVDFSYDAVHDIDPGSNHIAIEPGEQLTMEECLNAILIRSANEVSFAVAEHISGTTWQDFGDIMNERAKELGCVDSHFVNPNGLPNEEHYTSAYDLAMIGRAFFANEALCKMTMTHMLHILPSERQPDDIMEVNKMELIPGGKYAYPYLVGCKTGYTDVARSTLVSCAEKDGMKLITVLPDVVKSPKLTADWENALTLVSKGEYSMQEFMDGIENMVRDLVQTYHSISEEQKSMFGAGTQEALGKCPKCGGEVVKGKFGAYCKNKCGMNVGRAMGAVLSDSQIKSMLEGKKTLVKGLKGKKGSYDAYLIPESVQEFSYTKDGKEIKGFQYKFKMEFPPKKDK